MARLHLFEIIDQAWCPRVVREGVTDYLKVIAGLGNPYRLVLPQLRDALEALGTRAVVDLGSGSGGPWPELERALREDHGCPVEVTLTDLHPNPRAAEPSDGGPRIRRSAEAVDAQRVPAHMEGLRTMFSVFHHFRPAEARAILADAVAADRGIAVFEMTHRSLPSVLGMFMTPILAVLATPFVRPFSWARLALTYLVPVIPLVTTFDGVVSCLRTYSPAELLDLSRGLGGLRYRWQAGQVRSSAPAFIPVSYLIGTPTRPGQAPNGAAAQGSATHG